MRTWMLVASLGVSLALSGCGANFNSVYRKFDITKLESVSIDAKQRVIITGQKPGFVAANGDKVEPQLVACAEPSPDALSVLGASFGGSSSEAQQLAIQIAIKLSETGTNIGLRTQTITILRDAMYRLCEGYQSGALTYQAFERLQRRYQNAMLGLLAVEQLTGAVTPKGQPISASAPPSLAGDDGKPDGKKPAREDKKPSGDKPAAKPQPKDRAEDSKGNTKAGQKPAADGKPPVGQEAPGNVVKPLSDTATATVADTVYKIVKSVLDVDYTSETCLNYLVDDTGKSKDNAVIDFCRARLDMQKAMIEMKGTPKLQ